MDRQQKQKCQTYMLSMTNTAWHVYFLRCSDNSLYCGITKDIQRRLNQHNHTSKGAKYTRSRRPVELVWACKMESQSAALKLEAALKKKTKLQKEMIIEADFDYFDVDKPTV